jgi:hypothetical protein
VLGIGSNHSLDPASAAAATVYDDDWLAHLSDEDEEKGGLVTYYRAFGSLQDGVEMGGNCAYADREHACAYPCFDEQVTYGIAVKGFVRDGAGAAATRPVGIEVDVEEEPDPREGGKPVRMHASVTVRALTVGARYVLYRYGGINAFPASGVAGYDSEVAFTATATEWNHRDPEAFMSDDAVYYLAVPSKARPLPQEGSCGNCPASHPFKCGCCHDDPTSPFCNTCGDDPLSGGCCDRPPSGAAGCSPCGRSCCGTPCPAPGPPTPPPTPAPTPEPLYHCVSNKCVPASSGVTLSVCESVCGQTPTPKPAPGPCTTCKQGTEPCPNCAGNLCCTSSQFGPCWVGSHCATESCLDPSCCFPCPASMVLE